MHRPITKSKTKKAKVIKCQEDSFILKHLPLKQTSLDVQTMSEKRQPKTKENGLTSRYQTKANICRVQKVFGVCTPVRIICNKRANHSSYKFHCLSD